MQNSIVVPSRKWGVIIDVRDLREKLESSRQFKRVIEHVEPRSVIGNILISPDVYGNGEIYEKIYDICGGEFSGPEFQELTDHIDEIYRLAYDKVVKSIRRKYVEQSFMLHKWINENTALIGSMEHHTIEAPLPTWNDNRSLSTYFPLPWE